jgi:tetratricopeptide (TPR) repeat protein
MAEETEGQDSGAEASGAGVDPAAMALALGGASREKADAFLDDQRAMIADQRKLVQLQAKELSHELKLRHWSLWVRHASGVLRLALELSAGMLLLFAVTAIGVMVWNAAHADGLIIESFSVPPDMAARGLTGQVVATKMLDNLSTIQSQVTSARAPSSYANDWGNDLKVEIPETGISVGEAYRFLKEWLGHETHISGEVVRSERGITVTARAGGEAGNSFSGSESDFDALLQQATEAVYAGTQPYRYGVYLQIKGRMAEAEAFLIKATRALTGRERAWANTGLYNLFADQDRQAEACQVANAAIAPDPDFGWGWTKIEICAKTQDRPEAELAAGRNMLRLLTDSASSEIRPEAIAVLRQRPAADRDRVLGDYADAARQELLIYPSLADSTDPAQQVRGIMSVPGSNIALTAGEPYTYGADLIADHDSIAARRLIAEAPGYAAAIKVVSITNQDTRDNMAAAGHSFGALEMVLAMETGDWLQATRLADALDAEEAALDATYDAGLYPPIVIWPLRAYALAMRGDFKTAHSWIDRTPADCDICLRTRGKIDAAEKNYDGAAFWFAMAISKAPSSPIAIANWGQALLLKGDADGAIAKFTLANQKGPHFADPLEGWGEALMKKNQSHLALAKFTEAEKYAPNWGRLHLKWGEALTYAGKKDEAQKQFALAAGLDLSADDKAELGREDRQ